VIDDRAPRLELPDHLELVTHRVVLDGDKTKQVLRTPPVSGKNIRFLQATGDVRDDPLPVANGNQLARLGHD
jgi:hypothetical protein